MANNALLAVNATSAVAPALVNTVTQTLNVNGYVMAGLYARLRTTNDNGTPTFTSRVGQEVIQ